MTRAHYVKKARKDNPVCKKGESYYWWKFRYGGKRFSKTMPKPSQLTQSEFLGAIYDIDDRLQEMANDSEFESEISEICQELEQLKDTCEESLSNMPEQLQDAPTGELLQGRVDSVQEMIDELEGVDIEPEIDSEDDVKDDLEKEEDETDQEYNQRIEDELNQRQEDANEEILAEIQQVSYNGE